MFVNAHAISNQIVNHRESSFHSDSTKRREYLNAVIIGKWNDPIPEFPVGERTNRLRFTIFMALNIYKHVYRIEVIFRHQMGLAANFPMWLHAQETPLSLFGRALVRYVLASDDFEPEKGIPRQ